MSRITSTELAKHVNVTPQALYQARRRGDLCGTKTNQGYVYTFEQANAWLFRFYPHRHPYSAPMDKRAEAFGSMIDELESVFTEIRLLGVTDARLSQANRVFDRYRKIKRALCT